MNHCVQLIIITETVETKNTLMDAMRTRISPLQLLHKRMKEVLIDEKFSDQALNGLFAFVEKSRRPVENRDHESSCTFVEGVEKSGPIPNAVKVLSRFVETVATAVKKNVPIVETLWKK